MRLQVLSLAAALCLASACGAPAPVPLELGVDACDHCHMPVADPRFTAQLVTVKGRRYRFDDIGCMAAFLADGVVPAGTVQAAWVADFLHPGRWIPVEAAIYLKTDSLHTPMASGFIALNLGAPVDSVAQGVGGIRLDWAGVRAAAEQRRGS